MLGYSESINWIGSRLAIPYEASVLFGGWYMAASHGEHFDKPWDLVFQILRQLFMCFLKFNVCIPVFT